MWLYSEQISQKKKIIAKDIFTSKQILKKKKTNIIAIQYDWKDRKRCSENTVPEGALSGRSGNEWWIGVELFRKRGKTIPRETSWKAYGVAAIPRRRGQRVLLRCWHPLLFPLVYFFLIFNFCIFCLIRFRYLKKNHFFSLQHRKQVSFQVNF